MRLTPTVADATASRSLDTFSGRRILVLAKLTKSRFVTTPFQLEAKRRRRFSVATRRQRRLQPIVAQIGSPPASQRAVAGTSIGAKSRRQRTSPDAPQAGKAAQSTIAAVEDTFYNAEMGSYGP